MRLNHLHRALSIVAALAAALIVAPGASAAPLKPDLRGVQITSVTPSTSDAAIDADLAAAQNLGARVVRSDVHWSWIEPAQGQHDAAYLARADHLFARAHQLGIKVFLTILGTPCWTTTAPSPDCSTAAGRTRAEAYPPADDAAFASAAAFVAARWQADLAALEIWNEPDQRNRLYWNGPDPVGHYADLLKAAYPVIKQAAPSVTVAGAGIVGAGTGAFLKALYAKGIKGSYDVLSVHYYDLVLLSLGQIRAVRKAAGDTTPLWLGEYGWTSCLSKTTRTQDQHTCVSRATQASDTRDALAVLRTQKDLAGAILYTLRDTSQYDFGLIDGAGRRKPIYAAVSRAFHGHLGAPRAIRFRLRARGGHVVAQGSGPAGDAYIIDAKIGGRLRWRAAFRGDRANRFSIALPAVLGTRGITVSVRRYSVAGRAVVRHI